MDCAGLNPFAPATTEARTLRSHGSSISVSCFPAHAGPGPTMSARPREFHLLNDLNCGSLLALTRRRSGAQGVGRRDKGRSTAAGSPRGRGSRENMSPAHDRSQDPLALCTGPRLLADLESEQPVTCGSAYLIPNPAHDSLTGPSRFRAWTPTRFRHVAGRTLKPERRASRGG